MALSLTRSHRASLWMRRDLMLPVRIKNVFESISAVDTGELVPNKEHSGLNQHPACEWVNGIVTGIPSGYLPYMVPGSMR